MNLKEERKKRGITTKQIAEWTGYCYQWLYWIERGERPCSDNVRMAYITIFEHIDAMKDELKSFKNQ